MLPDTVYIPGFLIGFPEFVKNSNFYYLFGFLGFLFGFSGVLCGISHLPPI
jgi:hypothetical protein